MLFRNGEDMTENVLIYLQSAQLVEEEWEILPEIIVAGRYSQKDGVHRLEYDEALDDTGELTHNILKFSREYAHLHKNGQVQAEMLFVPEEENMFVYRTPYGDLVMVASTRDITLEEQPDLIRLKIEYRMDVQDQGYQILCSMEIKVHAA